MFNELSGKESWDQKHCLAVFRVMGVEIFKSQSSRSSQG